MDKFEYNRKRLFNQARKYADSIKCPKCDRKGENLKVINLYEYGDPNLPSQVVIVCKCGKFNQIFAQAPDEQARAYAKQIMEGDKGFKKATPEEAAKLIKLK